MTQRQNPNRRTIQGSGGQQGFFNRPETAGRGGYVGGFQAPDPTSSLPGVSGERRLPGFSTQDPSQVREFGDFQHEMLGDRIWDMYALPGQTAPITTGQAKLGAQRAAFDTWEQERQLFNRMEDSMMNPSEYYGIGGQLADRGIQNAQAMVAQGVGMSQEQNALATQAALSNMRAQSGAAGGSLSDLSEAQLTMQGAMTGRANEFGIRQAGHQMEQEAIGQARDYAGRAGQAIGTEKANAAQWLLSQMPGAPPSDVLTHTITDAEARPYVPGSNYLPEKSVGEGPGQRGPFGSTARTAQTNVMTGASPGVNQGVILPGRSSEDNQRVGDALGEGGSVHLGNLMRNLTTHQQGLINEGMDEFIESLGGRQPTNREIENFIRGISTRNQNAGQQISNRREAIPEPRGDTGTMEDDMPREGGLRGV